MDSFAKLRGAVQSGVSFTFHGIPIRIENPQHSIRQGIDAAGNKWACKLAAHYGEILGVKGHDGDLMDCFVGDFPESYDAYVISQFTHRQDFDEHKIMLGFYDQRQAVDAYRLSYQAGQEPPYTLIDCTIGDVKWWLENGDHTKPVTEQSFPMGAIMSQITNWDSNKEVALALYLMRKADSGAELLEPATFDSVLQELDGWDKVSSEELVVMDAMIVQSGKLERKMQQLALAFGRAGGALKLAEDGMTVSDPYRSRGTTVRAAIFELSDGQSITVFFHNPDVTPKKIMPTDELVSMKWLLNKKDITIVVAKENGKDLPVNLVATRVMRLAEKNSDRFQKANGQRATRLENIAKMQGEVQAKTAELQGLVERIQAVKSAPKAGASDDRLTVDAVANMKAGAVVRDQNGTLYELFSARHDWVKAHPIVNGKAQVNRDSTVTFHLRPETADAYPERNHSPLYLVESAPKVEPVIDAGDFERALSIANEGYAGKNINQAVIDKFAKALADKDADYIGQMVSNPDNKASQKIFQNYTGIVLGKTQKERSAQVDAWAGITPEDRLEAKAKDDAERKQRELEDAVKNSWAQVSPTKAKTRDGTETTIGAEVVKRFNAGWTIEQNKNGAVGSYVLLSKDREYSFSYKDKSYKNFLKAAAHFGGLKAALELVGAIAKDDDIAKDFAPQLALGQPIEVTGKELGEFPDTAEGKKAFREAIRAFYEPMRGKWVDCPILGAKVEIRKRGIDEMLSFSGDMRKLKLAVAIKQLIEGAKSKFWSDNYKPEKANKRGVAGYYTLKSDALLEGSALPVEILIEQDEKGLLHYDMFIDRRQTKAALDSSSAAMSSIVTPITNRGETGLGDIINQSSSQSAALDAATDGLVLNLFIEGEDAGEPIKGDVANEQPDEQAQSISTPSLPAEESAPPSIESAHQQFLQAVIDGKEDMAATDFPDRMIAAIEAEGESELAAQAFAIYEKFQDAWEAQVTA